MYLNQPAKFILASASPRRTEILETLGLEFDQQPQDIDESRLENEGIREYVQRLAVQKAQAAAQGQCLPALGADTVVVLDNIALGKPSGRDDAIAMLMRLSGRQHEVMTAVAMVGNGQQAHALSVSQVTFRKISGDEAVAYWETGEPADKAGGYAIQGKAAIFVESLQGSYSGVVGLPIFETASILAEFNIPIIR